MIVERLTSLCSFEYEMTSSPVPDGSDGIWPSTPPTTYIILNRITDFANFAANIMIYVKSDSFIPRSNEPTKFQKWSSAAAI